MIVKRGTFNYVRTTGLAQTVPSYIERVTDIPITKDRVGIMHANVKRNKNPQSW